MKKYIAIVLFLMVAFSMASPCVNASDNKMLSAEELLSMPEEEAVSVLIRMGLELPEIYLRDHELAKKSVHRVLKDINKDPLGIYSYNFTQLSLLADRICDLLEIKIDWRSYNSKAASDLVRSNKLYNYIDAYRYYNCYAYALGYTSGFDPGYFSGNSITTYSTYAIRDLIVSDLSSLGYSAYYVTNKPTSISSGQHVIALRCSSTDYHVMYAVNTSTWNHKPGRSSPLRWKYSSPGAYYWTNEGLATDDIYISPTETYTGIIYYIVYS